MANLSCRNDISLGDHPRHGLFGIQTGDRCERNPGERSGFLTRLHPLVRDARERLGGARPNVAVVNYAPGVVETDMQRGARSRPADEFPWVGLFLDFQSRGLVVTPEASAAPVATFLESDPVERYRDERFAG